MIRKIFMGLMALILFAGIIGCSDKPTEQPPNTEGPPITSTNTITIQEFINNALLDKYQLREIVEVSATFEGRHFYDELTYLYFYFGPRIDGFILMARVSYNAYDDVSNFKNLNAGDQVVIRGKYGGQSIKINGNGSDQGIVLTYSRVISVKKSKK